MPKFDYSLMPEVPPTFTPGDASAGLELVTLWIAKRLEERKPLSPELEQLFWTQAKRGSLMKYRSEGPIGGAPSDGFTGASQAAARRDANALRRARRTAPQGGRGTAGQTSRGGIALDKVLSSASM
ncbi:hypothetical protein [Rhizobium grahamii]|uniref:hypothetical protein n=1 Tax=Rhizobium grahamii TaxID=1120045 RepID=UPI0011B00F50|nr:hypothetical protein [Rhizobium grahamii]